MDNLGASGETWKTNTIPSEQFEVVKKELKEFKRTGKHIIWTNLGKFIKKHIPENKLDLLDVGCASGYFYEVFKILFGSKFNYVGSDYSEAMLALAKNNYPELKTQKIDIRQIELENLSYDVVFTSAVIEHVPEWKHAIKELTRICKTYLILAKTPISDDGFQTKQN